VAHLFTELRAWSRLARRTGTIGQAVKVWRRSAEAQAVDAERIRVRPDPHRPVEVQVMGPGFLDVLHARDVSEGGLGVWVPHSFEGCDLRAAVELIVTLPGTPSFHAAGILRHRTIDGSLQFFGVELTRISTRAHEALKAYVLTRHAVEAASPRSPFARRPSRQAS
jgi:hypothetical protein